MDLRVIHRPEPVEHEVLLVPGGRVLHLQVGLVADDVVDEVQADVGSGRVNGGEVEGFRLRGGGRGGPGVVWFCFSFRVSFGVI